MWKLLLGLALGYTLYSSKSDKDDYKIPDAELEKQTDEIIFKDDVVPTVEEPDIDQQVEGIQWKDRDLADILLEEGYTEEEVADMLESLEAE